jgi:hypothetical protein
MRGLHKYYTKPHKYNESQFNLYDQELLMKLWLNTIEFFCFPREFVYCVSSGVQTMHEAKISSLVPKLQLII